MKNLINIILASPIISQFPGKPVNRAELPSNLSVKSAGETPVESGSKRIEIPEVVTEPETNPTNENKTTSQRTEMAVLEGKDTVASILSNQNDAEKFIIMNPQMIAANDKPQTQYPYYIQNVDMSNLTMYTLMSAQSNPDVSKQPAQRMLIESNSEPNVFWAMPNLQTDQMWAVNNQPSYNAQPQVVSGLEPINTVEMSQQSEMPGIPSMTNYVHIDKMDIHNGHNFIKT